MLFLLSSLSQLCMYVSFFPFTSLLLHIFLHHYLSSTASSLILCFFLFMSIYWPSTFVYCPPLLLELGLFSPGTITRKLNLKNCSDMQLSSISESIFVQDNAVLMKEVRATVLGNKIFISLWNTFWKWNTCTEWKKKCSLYLIEREFALLRALYTGSKPKNPKQKCAISDSADVLQ